MPSKSPFFQPETIAFASAVMSLFFVTTVMPSSTATSSASKEATVSTPGLTHPQQHNLDETSHVPGKVCSNALNLLHKITGVLNGQNGLRQT